MCVCVLVAQSRYRKQGPLGAAGELVVVTWGLVPWPGIDSRPSALGM